jgi:hypothetical protein
MRLLVEGCELVSGRRYELGIVLSASLGCEKVVVAAARALRITPADSRPRMIDCALSLLCVQETAHCFEDVVLLMSKHSTNGRVLCVAPLGFFVSDAEVVGDAKHVALGYFNISVAAAISRTLRAVIHHPQRPVVFL